MRTGFLSCFAALFLSFAVLGASIDRTTNPGGGTITASDENAAVGEGKAQAFDNDINTKWLAHAKTAWIQYQFAGVSFPINEYDLTSANDAPGRDPRDWTFQGSNDGVNWTILDTRVGEAWTSRFQTRTFIFPNTTPYQYFKLDITKNGSDPLIQLAEIRLIEGAEDTTPPAIRDVIAPTMNQVKVIFTEQVNKSQAETTANYSINYEIGMPSAAVLGADNITVTLTVPNLTLGRVYTVTINNVTDAYTPPNEIAPDSKQEFRWIIDRTTTPGGGTITASAENSANGEGKDKAFDDNIGTKWLTFATSGWIQYQFLTPYVINEYSITTAGDVPERDPKDFTLQGSNDGTNFTVLDTRVGEFAGAARLEKRQFAFANTTPYTHYRLNVTAVTSPINDLQLSEIELFEAGIPWSLTVKMTGTGSGTVTSIPAGILFPNTPAALFPDKATVSLGAVADANSTFAGWSGDVTGTETGISVFMDADKTITARFVAGNGKPVHTFPGPQSMLEEESIVFDAGLGNGISVSDDDAALTTTLSVNLGRVQAYNQGTAVITNNDSSLVTINGTVAEVNVALSNIEYATANDVSGSDILTIKTTDGVFTTTDTVALTIVAVNDEPLLDFIDDPAQVNEDNGAQAIQLTGISAGANENQFITITAASSNPAIVPDSVITYTSPNATGTLTWMPAANRAGTATITVTVKDNGGSANGGDDTFTRTFGVSISQVNDAPTLDIIGDPAPLTDDAGEQTITLNGISSGPFEAQTVTITAQSDNPTLIADPAITYTNPDSTGTLNFTPVPNQSGTAVITVTLVDDGGTANGGVDRLLRTFTVTVQNVNSSPTLDAIFDPAAIPEDSGAQTLNLSGISAGTETQNISVTALSSNPSLIQDPTVIYTSLNATGSISYAPVTNKSGTALITIIVQDDGGTDNGGVDTVTQSFTVTVSPVNDAPSFTKGANQTVVAGSSAQSVVGWASNLSAGPDEGGQALNFIVTNDNNSLFAVQPAIDSVGKLTFTPGSNLGSAAVSVQLHDNGGAAGGGVDTSAAQTFTITLEQPPNPEAPNFSGEPLTTTGTVGAPFFYDLATNGGMTGVPTPTLTVQNVELPAGVATMADAGITLTGSRLISANLLKSGQLTVTLLASNATGSKAVNVVITITGGANNAAPVLSSNIGASANPAQTGTAVNFTAAATDADGDLLSYLWDFGDGTYDPSANRKLNTSRTFSAAGVYDVSLTVSDGPHGVTSHLQLIVTSGTTAPLVVSSAKIAFDFKTPAKSSLQIGGSLQVPTGTTVAGATVNVIIPGSDYASNFVLSSKGSSSDKNNLFTLKVSKTGGKFTLKVKGVDGTLLQKLASLGYANVTTPKTGTNVQLPLFIKLSMAASGQFASVRTLYKATQGKSGKAALSK